MCSRFGVNARTGCTFKVSRENLTSSGCAALRSRALELLTGYRDLERLQRARVAAFGDSDPNKVKQ